LAESDRVKLGKTRSSSMEEKQKQIWIGNWK